MNTQRSFTGNIENNAKLTGVRLIVDEIDGSSLILYTDSGQVTIDLEREENACKIENGYTDLYFNVKNLTMMMSSVYKEK